MLTAEWRGMVAMAGMGDAEPTGRVVIASVPAARAGRP